MPAESKTKAERLVEGANLLRQVLDIVKHDTAPGYEDLKEQIRQWVETGKSWDGRIDFPTIGRYAQVELPRSVARDASVNLKAYRALGGGGS